MTKPKSQNNLAQRLGISKAAVTKCKQLGMPVDSIEAARQWRTQNLDPARTKGSRFDRHRQPKPAAPEPDWFALAANSLDLAAMLLGAGQSIGPMIPALRAALHSVPEHERAALPLPLNVIKVLLKDVLAELPPRENNPLNDDGTPTYCNNMSDADAEVLGRFWYSLAAGEIRLA